MLEIENLDVSIKKLAILKGISLTVNDGELLSLLGPSGCGKSTLLKTIAGVLEQDNGKIILGGKDISRTPCHKRGTVIVFQDMRLFPNMNAVENVAFPLRMRGVKKSERLKIASEYLALVQLAGLEQRGIGELSGGQQQRVALARALAAKPELLLLDEPFSSLDENLREDMRQLVLSLHREFKLTTILVTHDRQEALTLSDRVAVMFNGVIQQTGTPMELSTGAGTNINSHVADYFSDCDYISGVVKNGIFSGGGLTFKTNNLDGEYMLMVRTGNILIKKG